MIKPNSHCIGLGLRQEFLEEFATTLPQAMDFIELAPENWIGVGGKRKKLLDKIAEHYPFVCHGLCLSIGGPQALDFEFLKRLKTFLQTYDVSIYSDHISFSHDDGNLYDLLPMPFTEEAIHHISARIRRVQDFLERPLVLENITYYCTPDNRLREIDFINGILEQSACQLLLDVNNVYVNSCNHGYDATDFIHALPKDCVRYMHVAGHAQNQQGLLIDNHGAAIIPPVKALLTEAYRRFGPKPTLLERDNDIPPLATLLEEIQTLAQLQTSYHEHATV